MSALDDSSHPDQFRLHHLTNRPARSFQFGPLIGAVQQLVGGAGLWVGGAIEETTGLAGGRLVIGDGSNGAIANSFGPFTFLAGQSRVDYFPPRGLVFERGLIVQATAGTIAGSLYVVLMERDELAFVQAHAQGFGGR